MYWAELYVIRLPYLKTFLASMCAQMALKLVAARETFPAEQPVAHERSLSGMPTQMRLKLLEN